MQLIYFIVLFLNVGNASGIYANICIFFNQCIVTAIILEKTIVFEQLTEIGMKCIIEISKKVDIKSVF